MPVKGFSSITVSDELKDKLEKIAAEHQESLPDTIKRLLNGIPTTV
jgi:predicted transcriptional regulator